MYTRIVRDLMPAFAGLTILGASFVISTNPMAGVWQQKPEKRIKTDALHRPEREPVIVTGLKLGTREINLNLPFEDNDDEWLRNLSFKVKNQSNENITYVGVNLFVPAESSSNNPGMVQQFRLGRLPNDTSSKNAPILLKSGDAIDLSITESKYRSIKQFIDANPALGKVNSVMVKVYLVFFENGTKWDGGEFYQPDPSQSSGFKRIDPPSGIIRTQPMP